MKRFKRRHVLLAAIVAAAATSYGGYQLEACGCNTPVFVVGGGGGVGTANIWVDGNGGTCSRSSSLASYVDSFACGSFDAANDVCQNGDLVRVMTVSTTYVGQSLSGSNGRTTNCTIQADTGTITVNGAVSTSAGAGRLVLKNVHQTIDTPNYSNILDLSNGTNVTVFDATATKLDIGNGAASVAVNTSSFGPCIADYRTTNNGVCNNRVYGTANGVTVSDTTLHGTGIACGTPLNCTLPNNIPHSECLAVFGGSNVIFQRDKMYDCGDSAVVLIQADGAGNQPTNYSFIGNWFNVAWNDNALNGSFTDEKCTGFDIANASLRGAWVFSFNALNICQAGPVGPGLEINWIGTTNSGVTSSVEVGNIGTNVGNCTSVLTAAYNVQLPWNPSGPTAPCGSNSVVISSPPPFVNLNQHGSFDFHLSGANGSTAADNIIPVSVTGGCPPFDIDGQARPIGTNCDAGPDER